MTVVAGGEALVLIQQVVNGLALGGIYALIAIGWTTVFGVVGMINWTHGDIFMIGAFVGFFVIRDLGLGLLGALLAAMLVSGVLAVLVDRLAYRPLKGARLALFITALGASTFLRNLGLVLWQPDSRAYPEIVETKMLNLFRMGGGYISINSLHLLIIIVTFAIMAVLQLFITRTKVGRAMLAASQDLEATELMGVEVHQLVSVTYFISGMLGGAAGVLVGVLYAIDPMMGAMAGLKGWAVAVLGGVGSITGAMVGGLLLGVAENVAGGLNVGGISLSGYKDAIAFLIMILTLLIRPNGLLGQRFEEKV